MSELKEKVKAIHHIAIQTSDIEKTINFYVKVLGCELVDKYPFKKRTMAWLKINETFIEVFSKRDDDQLMKWNDLYSGPVHISFIVENLEPFISQAIKLGAKLHPSHPEIFTPPVNGAKPLAYLLGPDGEEIEIKEQ